MDALLARDFSDVSEATLTQLRSWQRDFASETLDELVLDWTFYPRGIPEQVKLYVSMLELDGGELAFLMQCVPQEEAVEPKLLRDAEALRHTSSAVALLTPEGEILNRNPAACEAFGAESELRDWFGDPALVAEVLAVAEHGQIYATQASSRRSGGRRWYALEARKTLDPVNGEVAVLVHMLDETARLGAERDAREKGELVAELSRALTTVEEQRERWQALVDSAPELIVILGAEGQIEFANAGVNVGEEPERLVGRPAEALLSPGTQAKLTAAIQDVRATGEVACFEAICADASRVLSVRLVASAAGEGTRFELYLPRAQAPAAG